MQYFFHIRDAERIHLDLIGESIPDVRTAETRGWIVAAKLSSDGRWHGTTLLINDENGN